MKLIYVFKNLLAFFFDLAYTCCVRTCVCSESKAENLNIIKFDN